MTEDTTQGPESGRPREQMGDSFRELFHPDENVGATDAEHDRQQEAKQEAAHEAEALRQDPNRYEDGR